MNAKPKILITRTDRLGDVLMALPSVTYLRKLLPQAELHFLCQALYEPVVGPYLNSIGVESVVYERPNLRQLLAREKYQAALMLFCDSAILSSIWGGVPFRVGIYSKPLSFLTLSRGSLQHRSSGLKSEARYNIDLAKILGEKFTDDVFEPVLAPITLPVNSDAQSKAKAALRSLGVDAGQNFVVLHPGSSGSALNLSPERYAALLDILRDFSIVITKGPSPMDERTVGLLKNRYSHLPIVENQPLDVLMEVFRFSKQVIAPSTGTLHLAHYVGTPTLGIFPPVRSERAERWQPFGGSGKSESVTPQFTCRATKRCLGERCESFFCMDRMPLEPLILKMRNDLVERVGN